MTTRRLHFITSLVLFKKRCLESNYFAAFVTSYDDSTTFSWESVENVDGYTFVDLKSAGIVSANPKTFSSPVQHLAFDLVIPGGTLDPASKFLFRLSGMTSIGNVASSSVEVVTRSGPFDGQFEVKIL